MRNFLQTQTLFYTYDFLKDKVGVLHKNGEFPFPAVKLL
jgi:hypothetical protein